MTDQNVSIVKCFFSRRASLLVVSQCGCITPENTATVLRSCGLRRSHLNSETRDQLSLLEMGVRSFNSKNGYAHAQLVVDRICEIIVHDITVRVLTQTLAIFRWLPEGDCID